MTMRDGRQLALIATLFAMFLALLLVSGFVWLATGQISVVVMLVYLLWMLAYVGTIWWVAVGCIEIAYRPKLKTSKFRNFTALSFWMVVLVGSGGILWLFINMLDPEMSGGWSNWFVSVAISGLLAVIIGSTLEGRRFPVPVKSATMIPGKVEEYNRRRMQILQDLDMLANTPWLAAAEAGTAPFRLRAALAWWREELGENLPVTLRPTDDDTPSAHLHDARVMINVLERLRDRDEHGDDVLNEMERRVFDLINRATRLSNPQSE